MRAEKAVREFDRFAASYAHYSIIQRQAAARLVSWIEEADLGRVLDIGCGDGEILRQLRKSGKSFERFLGVDLSASMLQLHARNKRVRCLCGDFNDATFLESLKEYAPQTLLSSSALQWAGDLDATLRGLSSLGSRAYFSLFTAGTFATLHRLAGLASPIRSFEESEAALRRHYRIQRLERVRYRLHFESRREIFRYIKRSGVSGGEARLGVRAMRRLMEEYPLDYLEFELLFASTEPTITFSRS